MYSKTYPWEAGETLEAVMKHINAPPIPISQVVPDIDKQVADCIMRGLEKNPNDRWQTVDEMLGELRAARARLQPHVV